MLAIKNKIPRLFLLLLLLQDICSSIRSDDNSFYVDMFTKLLKTNFNLKINKEFKIILLLKIEPKIFYRYLKIFFND